MCRDFFWLYGFLLCLGFSTIMWWRAREFFWVRLFHDKKSLLSFLRWMGFKQLRWSFVFFRSFRRVDELDS